MGNQKIVVIGSSNTDMVVQSDHLPLPGETVLGDRFVMNPGGKGANQAVSAADLDGVVVFVCRLGEYDFGTRAIEGFKSHGIDTKFISRDAECASGVALILVDGAGENSISVALGANQTLTPQQLQPVLPMLSEGMFVLTQLETSLSTIEFLGAVARDKKLKLVLNPAPAQKLSDELLNSLYLISPNQIEAELLTGVKVENEETARKAARFLRTKGVEVVVITMGSKGAYVLSEDVDELVPSIPVRVVDTTAAGDTFNGAMVVALNEGKRLKSAIEFANKAAAYAVGILGAQNATPRRKDIENQS